MVGIRQFSSTGGLVKRCFIHAIAAPAFASSSRSAFHTTYPAHAESSQPKSTVTTTTLEEQASSSESTDAESSSTQAQPESEAPRRRMPRFETPTEASESRQAPPRFSTSTSDSPLSRDVPTTYESQNLRLTPQTRKGSASLSSKQLRYAPFNREPDPTITHELVVTTTRNNTHIAFVDSIGRIGGVISGGTGRQFKGQGRSTYEAAHQAILKQMENVIEYANRIHGERIRIRLAFRGLFGPGREAVHQAIAGPTGEQFRPLIGRIEDRTTYPMGGARPRKPRRM